MRSFNQIILMGNTGKDPILTFAANGNATAKFSMATTEHYGEDKKEPDWHNIYCYGKLAEIVGEYVKKGMYVRIVGRSKTLKFKDKDFPDKMVNWPIVIADRVDFDKPREQTSNSNQNQQQKQSDHLEPDEMDPNTIPF